MKTTMNKPELTTRLDMPISRIQNGTPDTWIYRFANREVVHSSLLTKKTVDLYNKHLAQQEDTVEFVMRVPKKMVSVVSFVLSALQSTNDEAHYARYTSRFMRKNNVDIVTIAIAEQIIIDLELKLGGMR